MKKWMYMAAGIIILSTSVSSCCSKKKTQSAQTVSTQTELLEGKWDITTVNGKKVVGEEPAFLMFDLKEKRIHGNNGCNIINGELITDNNGTFRMDKVISTMRACGGENSESEIMKALNSAQSFKIDSKGKMKLYDTGKKEILSLKKPPFSELEGSWDVTLIDGKPLTGDQKPFITFDTKEKRVFGSAGCNRMNGKVTTDNANEYNISFGQMATTRMACPGNTEQTFLAALNNVKSFKLLPNKDGKASVGLCDDKGNVTITLQKKN